MNLFIKYIVGFFFLAVVFDAKAQSKSAQDSLKNIISTFENKKHEISLKDTSVIDAYIELSTYNLNNQPDSSFKLKQTAKNLADELLKKTNEHSPAIKIIKNEIAASLLGFGLFYELKGDRKKAIEAYNDALKIFEEINYQNEVSKVLNNIATLNVKIGKVNEALDFFKKNIAVLEQLGNKQGLAVTMNNIAYICYNQGDIKKALDYYTKSMKILEEIDDPKSLATLYNSIAGLYSAQSDYDKTIEYINKSYKIFEKLNDKTGIAFSYNNLGSTYEKLGKLTEAEQFYNTSLNYRKELEDKSGISVCYNNIAGIKIKQATKYKAEKKIEDFKSFLKEAEDYYNKSLQIKKEINDKIGLANVYLNLANLGLINGNLASKTNYITEAYKITKELGFPAEIQKAAALMKKLSEQQGNFTNAYFYLNEEIKMRDSIQNQENYKATQKQQARYEYQKKAAADSITNAKAMEIKDLDLAKQKAESQRQKVIIYSFLAGFIIILFFAIIIYRMFLQKKKANKLLAEQKQQIEYQNHTLQQANEEINAQKEEIEAQRDLVTQQKDHIEEIHKDLTDSINYAERIQRSFIATKSLLDANLNDYFVLFRPKDVVSGDFYWAGKLKNNHFALVTADSTGHGVPGAIMSILNISSIEKAIENGLCEPAEIFNMTRKNIIDRLKNDGSTEGGKDGMDASIIIFETANQKFKYSTANNPIWVIRNNELIELEPDKMPLGKHDKDNISFTQNEFEFQNGDLIYTLSDGFSDQFGGPKHKKFLSKNLKQMLITNCKLPMNEQKQILEKALIDWIGDGEQIDDITVLGIRI